MAFPIGEPKGGLVGPSEFSHGIKPLGLRASLRFLPDPMSEPFVCDALGGGDETRNGTGNLDKLVLLLDETKDDSLLIFVLVSSSSEDKSLGSVSSCISDTVGS